MHTSKLISTALNHIYMKEKVLAVLSLMIVADVKDGKDKSNTIQGCFKECIDIFKKLPSINIESYSLAELLDQLENQDTRDRALVLLQKYHKDLVSQINLLVSRAQKNPSIRAYSIITKILKLRELIYSPNTIVRIIVAVRNLALSNDGFEKALKCFESSEEAIYFLYQLITPINVLNRNEDESNIGDFLYEIERNYRKSSLRNGNCFRHLLYWIFNYYASEENYNEMINILSSSTKKHEVYYIINKSLYQNFPAPSGDNIDEKLRSTLVSSADIHKNTNAYFKELERVKSYANDLRTQKSQKVGSNLKQAILMNKLNLAVAMLQELSSRLSKLDIKIKDSLSLPLETVVNSQKLPKFIEWRDGLDEIINEYLTDKRHSFLCLFYHRVMSAILTKYNQLSNIYETIYKDTEYDDQSIRKIIKNKSRIITKIQMAPRQRLEDACQRNGINKNDQKLIVKLLNDTHHKIIPITQNSLEEFSYIDRTPIEQYEVALRGVHKHPLYPLITIYSEWYKLRSFILFFESFGTKNSNYLRGFESENGVFFESLYKDLVYLSYYLGQIYNQLDQYAKSILLKYLAIFSAAPNNRNYHLAFKKFAIIESFIFTHTIFDRSSFKEILYKEADNDSFKISPLLTECLKNDVNISRFIVTAVDRETRTLKYKDNNQYKFEMIITNDEYIKTEREIKNLEELDKNAIFALALIAFIKNYNDLFLTDTITRIDLFPGLYTRDIFAAWRSAGVQSSKGILRFVNLDNEHNALKELFPKIKHYSSSKDVKNRANNILKNICQKILLLFNKGIDINLHSFEQDLSQIDKMLVKDEITKGHKSKIKKYLKQAKVIITSLHQKLIYLDICCFSQHTITSLKPFAPNKNFIDLTADRLSRTFVRNHEVIVNYNSSDIVVDEDNFANRRKRRNAIDDCEMISSSFDANQISNSDKQNQLILAADCKSEEEILGIAHDSDNKRIAPRDITNKFYVFLKISIKLAESYMDAIMRIFDENFEITDETRFDRFLDKLLEDFQIAINIDFKENYLDDLVGKLGLNRDIIHRYLIDNFDMYSDHFRNEYADDLFFIDDFIENDTLGALNIRAFNRAELFDASYKELELIKTFNTTYEEIESIYEFIADNKDFIILSRSDLLSIYNIQEKGNKGLNSILSKSGTKAFKLEELKLSLIHYEKYITEHIIYPQFNDDIVLASSLSLFEFDQIIMIIYQDLLENPNDYKGNYKPKWWHVASAGLGAAIDYFYTTTNLARGIREIQAVILYEQDTRKQINQIITIANKRLRKNSKRKDRVSRLYTFLDEELNTYIKIKLAQQNNRKIDPLFEIIPERPSNDPRFSFDRRHSINSDTSVDDLEIYNPDRKCSISSSSQREFRSSRSYSSFDSIEEYSFDKKSDRRPSFDIARNYDMDELGIQERMNLIAQYLEPLYLIDDEAKEGLPETITNINIADARIRRSSFISNHIVNICLGRMHQDYTNPISLNPDDRFIIRPCYMIDTRMDTYPPYIEALVEANRRSLILLPVNHSNTHFTLFIIDTRNRRSYYYDSLGNNYDNWINNNLVYRLVSIRDYRTTYLTNSFQINNDCGFLVLEFMRLIYINNNLNLDIRAIYNQIMEDYGITDLDKNRNSRLLRQRYCDYAGAPFFIDF